MRFGYNLLLGILLSIALMSSANAAVIAGVKVFSGANFTSSIGGIFIPYGIDSYTIYDNVTDNLQLYYSGVMISSTIDDNIVLRNGTCKSTRKYTYCYKGSVIDTANPLTYAKVDYLQPTMTITIESIPSPTATVLFTRDKVIKSYCGELIKVPLLVSNSGTLTTNFTYTEILPANTLVTATNGGDVNGNVITFRDIVPDNVSKNYSYVMTNFDCQSKSWNATYSFTSYNETINRNLNNLSIIVQNAYQANFSLSKNKTNNPDDIITYTWVIANLHPSIPLQLDISFNIPGAIIDDASSQIVRSSGSNRYLGTVSVGNILKLYVKFHEPDYDNYMVYTNGTININDHEIVYNSNSSLYVSPPVVETYMIVNTTKNNSLYVSVWAQNYDLSNKYYYIYGTLKGIGDEEPIYANGINPDSTLLVATKYYNTTGMGLKDINMTFDGIYRDKNSFEYKLHAEQLVTINSPKIVQSNATKSSNVASKTTPTVSTISGSKTTTGNASKDTNTTGTGKSTADKKDFITKIIEGLSKFLQSIFG